MYGHIYHNITRPSPELLEAFAELPTATLCDAMGRHGAVASSIRPIFDDVRMVGSALTVLCFPNDNLMVHKAVTMVQPGDILVVDEGDYGTGCFGLNTGLQTRDRGGKGAVLSGSLRDLQDLRRERFPVFARGVSPRSPQKNTPGSINVPVHLGGIVIHPGDIIVGDGDGLVVIPLPMAEQTLEKARQRDLKEKSVAVSAAGELPLDPSGAEMSLDAILKDRVVEHHEPAPWRRDL